VIGKNLHCSVHPFYFAVSTAIGGLLTIIVFDMKVAVLRPIDIVMLTLAGLCSWI
jgi:hypothetical protein